MTYVFTSMCNFLFRLNIRYYQGPIILPTRFARTIPITSTGFAFVMEIVVYSLGSGYSCVEVELIHQERVSGRSKSVSISNILISFDTIFRLWWKFLKKNTILMDSPNSRS